MYTYSIIITRNGQEIKKFLDFLPVLSIYFSIECQLLLEVKSDTKNLTVNFIIFAQFGPKCGMIV